MALCQTFPYSLREYRKDCARWMVSTEVSAERQGPLLALAIGGAARSVVDEIEDQIIALGTDADFNDGLGRVHRSGPALRSDLLDRNSQRMQKRRCSEQDLSSSASHLAVTKLLL